MNIRKLLNLAVIVATVAGVFAFNRAIVRAAPAANDSFASPTAIGSLPFTDAVDLSEATTEPGEPQFCNFMASTVWYAYTPATNVPVHMDIAGSIPANSGFNVYQAFGPDFNSLSFVGCGNLGSSVSFTAQAGSTYYIQTGTASSCPYPPCNNAVQLNVQEVPPPANDNFTNPVTVSGLPFDHVVDPSTPTREPDEPQPSCVPDPAFGSVWYAFTPGSSGSVTAWLGFAPYYTTLAVYTGSALSSLSLVDCRAMWSPLTFRAEAGTAYYFQVAISYLGTGSLQFHLEETPPPQAYFSYFPGAPSSLDTVQFYDFSYDPAGSGIQTQSWDFGDGAIATGCCPTHRYTADGDYVVQLTVTTYDGRTGTTTQTVPVRTHDVAITKFQVPNSASAGQTRQIVVGLRNYNQPETVRIELYRSTPGGFQLIGYLDQFVPVRSGNRTTDFQFSYTFTTSDAAVGKVNFRAIATILGTADNLPADNEAISLPTKVGR
jgi:hypothetical protein